mgnify:CR=1 FL=1
MLEKLAKSIEEVNVLAEHYRTCQNVAAIESLAKECFISKEDTDAFIAGKRKFLLKVLLTQSVSVTEKLTEEMLLLQDSGYATVLGTYLLDLARKDPVMKDVILQPHKTLRHCIEYVHEKAYETALEKAKKEGKTGVGQNAGIAIGSTEVFAWVIDYYLLDDRKDMGEKKRRKKKDTIKKAWERAESIRTLSAKSKDSDTKKDVSEDAKVAAKPATQKKEEPEQLSLFNLGA